MASASNEPNRAHRQRLLVNELHLFAGAGGGILGGILLGHTCVCAVEIREHCRSVLLQRQKEGFLPPFPIWDDILTFDSTPWRGSVDVVCGGFPCQDISAAGKGEGIDGERSGLWREMARVVREVGPRFVFVENSPMLTSRGLGRVLGDLAQMGYDAEWGVFGASDAIFLAGDPILYHDRYRIFILAMSQVPNPQCPKWGSKSQPVSRDWQKRLNSLRRRQETAGGIGAVGSMVSDTHSSGLEEWGGKPGDIGKELASPKRMHEGAEGSYGHDAGLNTWPDGGAPTGSRSEAEREMGEQPEHRETRGCDSSWWSTEPIMGRMAHGVANRVDRLKSTGNGQVPAVVVLAWKTLLQQLTQPTLPKYELQK